MLARHSTQQIHLLIVDIAHRHVLETLCHLLELPRHGDDDGVDARHRHRHEGSKQMRATSRTALHKYFVRWAGEISASGAEFSRSAGWRSRVPCACPESLLLSPQSQIPTREHKAEGERISCMPWPEHWGWCVIVAERIGSRGDRGYGAEYLSRVPVDDRWQPIEPVNPNPKQSYCANIFGS